MHYGHGSWIALAVFAGMIALRMLSSQRRRGGGHYRGGRFPGSSSFDSGGSGRAATPMTGSPSTPGTATGTVTGTAPGWFADPFFKHDHRYWSGTEWTEHVSDDGVPGTDPPPGRPQPQGSG